VNRPDVPRATLIAVILQIISSLVGFIVTSERRYVINPEVLSPE